MSRPVQILVIQHGRVISKLCALQKQESRDRREQGDSTNARSHEPMAKRCLYVDSKAPFSVIIYRHKACERLREGFWHTESLNGRVRMGNASDRSMPHSAVYSSSESVASSSSDESVSGLPGDRTTPPPILRDENLDEMILCGRLWQKPSAQEGVYKLRISPSMSPSKSDHMLAFRYRDVNLNPTCPRTESPEPCGIDGSMSPAVGSIQGDEELPIAPFPDGPKGQALHPLDSTAQITPVAFRVSQINLRGRVTTDSAARMGREIPRSASTDNGAFTNASPRKRKLESAERPPSSMPDSICNIQQYMPMESPLKRINHGPYPRSQPSWCEAPPHCAPVPVVPSQMLGGDCARKILSCELMKGPAWNERSYSF